VTTHPTEHSRPDGHRQFVVMGVTSCGKSAVAIAARMQARTDHFMPLSLLDSQLALLEPLEQDEHGVVIDITSSLDSVVEQTVAFATPLLPPSSTGQHT